MATDLMVLVDDMLRLAPVTSTDREKLSGIAIGHPFKITLTNAKVRSLQHHRLFFGGLMRLGFEYWEPSGGLVSAAEKSGIEQFAKFLDSQHGSTIVSEVAKQYIDQLTRKRAAKIQAPHKSAEQFRKWVIIEAGYYDLAVTPNGLIKVAKSISFANMGQEEFNDLYKSCFSVIWRLVLSKTFDSELECQAAIDNLCSMG